MQTLAKTQVWVRDCCKCHRLHIHSSTSMTGMSTDLRETPRCPAWEVSHRVCTRLFWKTNTFIFLCSKKGATTLG